MKKKKLGLIFDFVPDFLARLLFPSLGPPATHCKGPEDEETGGEPRPLEETPSQFRPRFPGSLSQIGQISLSFSFLPFSNGKHFPNTAPVFPDSGSNLRSDLGSDLTSDLGSNLGSDLTSDLGSNLGSDLTSDLGLDF